MHGGGHTWWGWGMHGRGACMAGGHAWQVGMHGRGQACMAEGGMHGRGCMWWGHAWHGGMHGRGECVAGEMAIAVGSIHPTGMHSC